MRIRALMTAALATACALPAGSAGGPGVTLADAVEQRDQVRAHAALQAGSPVNAVQPDGMSALHWAAYHDDVALARALVAAGAKAGARNRYGVTPLALACTNGSAAMVELLLEAGADPNAILRGGETALMTAARTGRLEPVRILLERGADADAREENGQTALMWAAADGHGAVVEFLIAQGADFRTPLASGFTPLFFAVREGRTDAVQALLRAGVDVNEPMAPRGRTMAKAPRKGTTPLHLAVENGHFELGLALLEAGANPNDQRSGYTPLHMLTWVRKPDRGDNGDPAPVGSGTVTSLQFARHLVAHGANVNARLERGPAGGGRVARKGATPFLMAADTADIALMRLLVEFGANPHLPNAENCTPLLAAAGVGTRAPEEEAGTEAEALEAVRYALELGGDVNATDDNGETAMHGAAYASFPRVVKLLAASGADIEVWNRKNKRGWTPLLIAQGHRFGNFKPSVETIAAIEEVMKAAGVVPPPPPASVAARPYAR